jgi:hypothetical protein
MKFAIAGLLALTLVGCASTGHRAPVGPPAYDMSTGAGPINPACGQFKLTDSRCNPAMSAGGG